MNAGKCSRNIKSVTRRPPLRLDADGPHPCRQFGQLIGYLYQLVVKLLIINAFKDLVVPVQSPVKTVVGTPPQPLAKLQIVLPPLSDGPKETHLRTQRY